MLWKKRVKTRFFHCSKSGIRFEVPQRSGNALHKAGIRDGHAYSAHSALLGSCRSKVVHSHRNRSIGMSSLSRGGSTADIEAT